jgi:hypothetical protein
LDVGLPREIDTDLPRKKLRDLPPSARSLASAVYLDPADGRSPEDAEAFHPVVILSGGVQAVVDTVTLGLVRDAAGNAHLPLDARALDGGRRLVFAQSGAVVVVDLPTAAVTRIPVPDRHLEWAGWATGQGGPHIVALSADAGWLIDAEARTVTGPTDGDGEARIGPYALVADPAGATLDESHGDVRGRYALPWPMVEPWGDTMGAMSNGTNVDWVASAAFLGDTTTKGLDVTMPYQGLVALRVSGQTRMATLEMRLAVFGEDPPRTKGCCRVVGWDRSGRHILYETETATGTHVLAWDIETGTFARVMLVTGTKRVPGGLVALGAGIQRN